jgi:hypothetical protein
MFASGAASNGRLPALRETNVSQRSRTARACKSFGMTLRYEDLLARFGPKWRRAIAGVIEKLLAHAPVFGGNMLCKCLCPMTQLTPEQYRRHAARLRELARPMKESEERQVVVNAADAYAELAALAQTSPGDT